MERDSDTNPLTGPRTLVCGPAMGALIWALLIAGALLLTGRATRPELELVPGYECDVTGACWPRDFTETKNVRVVRMDKNEVEKACASTRTSDPDLTAHDHWRVFACTLAEDSPSPIIVLPDKAPPCFTLRTLERHERGHAAGVTVHNMVERNLVCEGKVTRVENLH